MAVYPYLFMPPAMRMIPDAATAAELYARALGAVEEGNAETVTSGGDPITEKSKTWTSFEVAYSLRTVRNEHLAHSYVLVTRQVRAVQPPIAYMRGEVSVPLGPGAREVLLIVSQ